VLKVDNLQAGTTKATSDVRLEVPKAKSRLVAASPAQDTPFFGHMVSWPNAPEIDTFKRQQRDNAARDNARLQALSRKTPAHIPSVKVEETSCCRPRNADGGAKRRSNYESVPICKRASQNSQGTNIRAEQQIRRRAEIRTGPKLLLDTDEGLAPGMSSNRPPIRP